MMESAMPARFRPRPPHVFIPSLVLGLSATLAGGCATDAPSAASGDLTTAFDTIAGVVRVTNAGAPPEWRLTRVVSIGPGSVTEEEAPDEFGRVSAVALGPDGTVFVADIANSEIRVFGPDGSHLRTFGRDGEGPGEFRSIYSVAWVGDRLLTYDPSLGRIGEFSGAGEWLGQRRTAGSVSGSPAFMRFFPVGPDEAFRVALGGRFIWVGIDSRGDTGDTVPWLSARGDLPGMVETVVCEGGGVSGFYPHAAAAKHVQHPASGGVMYSAWGYFYRVAVTGGDGDTLRVIERTLPTEPVSDERWAAGSAEFEEAKERFQFSSRTPTATPAATPGRTAAPSSTRSSFRPTAGCGST